jgi:flavodoxin
MSSKIVIVYHSGYGHTSKVAEAVATGSGGQLVPIDAEGNLPEGGWDALEQAQAIVFGSPTYMGNVSWQFKKFADQSSKVWAQQGWKDKLGAAFTNSASVAGDKQTTLYTLFTLAQLPGATTSITCRRSLAWRLHRRPMPAPRKCRRVTWPRRDCSASASRRRHVAWRNRKVPCWPGGSCRPA